MFRIDDLVERDKRRKKDGFPEKLRIGRIIKPVKGGKNKFIFVPVISQDKFIHDRIKFPQGEGSTGGAGEGDVGDVIHEEPIDGEGTGSGAGEGGGGDHELVADAYEIGKVLTEQLSLPNLTKKGKKRSLSQITFDLNSKRRGEGQLLDRRATLENIARTNLILDTVGSDLSDVENMVIDPNDLVFRVFSPEKDYESQALVFFCRDYSYSMVGKPAELIVRQHVMVYCWLMYQYKNQVKTRFIVHDESPKEVPDFHSYFSSQVNGGTKISPAFRLINEIIRKERLAKDYNIYVLYGTDGDDWEKGEEAIKALKELTGYANRIGLTVVRSIADKNSSFEQYILNSGLLKQPKLIRMDTVSVEADDSRLIDGIRKLMSP